MLGKATPDDVALEKAWLRMWGRHLLIFLGYLLIFMVLYFRMRQRIADEAYFFWEQRILSRKLLLTMGLHLAAVLIGYRKLWTYRWQQFFSAPASPYNLAFVRIVFFATMLIDCLFVAPQQWLPLAGLPDSARQPLPFIGWFIEIVPITPTFYTIALILTVICASLAVLGLFSRSAMLALIPLIFYIYGVPQFFGKMNHNQFFVWITVILAMSPCFEVWSIDGILRRLRGMRADRKPRVEYALGLRWIMLSMAGIYFFSGVRKLYESGLFWAVSDNPVNLLRTEWLEQFRDVPFIRVDEWPLLCSIAAGAVILFEISYPFVLISRRGKLLLAIEAILFHNLNGYFLKIDFVYLKTAHLSYLDWGGIRKWLLRQRRWVAWVFMIAVAILAGRLLGTFFLFPFFILGAIIDLSWRAIPLRKRHMWILALRKQLPALPPRTTIDLRNRRRLRWSFATGVILLSLNTACGALGINSWPFSAYPSYSYLRTDHMQYGWFLPRTASGQVLDLDVEAQAAHFRKENILPMAERIVVAWKYAPQDLESTILQCWLRWQTELPTLQKATQVQVVIRSYPIDPDHYDEIVEQIPLGDLKLQDSQWIFVPLPTDSLSPALQ